MALSVGCLLAKPALNVAYNWHGKIGKAKWHVKTGAA